VPATVLALVLALVAALTGGPAASPAAAAPGSPPAATAPIAVDLVALSPSAPDAAALEQPVNVTAVLTNTTATAYTDLQVRLERGAPIVQRVLLHEAQRAAPDTVQWSTDPLALPAALAPGASVTVVYTVTAQAMGLFLNGVYPYDVVVQGRAGDGPRREAGRTALLVPSFIDAPAAPLRVSWFWPLIDVPHLEAGAALDTGAEAVFRNDDLSASVRADGRLDRALRVVEAVTPAVRMTVVIDPALIDELLRMADGYQVRSSRSGSSATIAGAGAEAAQAWLARLKAVAGQQDIVLTGYADPDLDSIAASGLPRPDPLSPALAARVSTALGTTYRSDLVWPAGEALSPAAADLALNSGASTILLRDTALSGGTRPDTSSSGGGVAGEVRGLSDTALAPLTLTGANAPSGAAIVLDSSLRLRVDEATADAGIRPAGDRSTADRASTAAVRVQALLAELALWPLSGATDGGYVALAPERAVDPDATAAAAAILSTTTAAWMRVVPIREAVTSPARFDRGGLAEPPAATRLDPALVAAITGAQSALAAAADLVGTGELPALSGAQSALRIATSAAWRGDPAAGAGYADAAAAAGAAINGAVTLVTPDNASYSLSSENSPLILTVRNDLDVAVSITVRIDPASASVTGFRAGDIGVQVIEPNTARTLQIPAHFERSGRFEVVAQLGTGSGAPLGEPVRLSVLCTAYGTVALTITIAAFVLLLLLLAFRGVRGLRRRAQARATRPLPPAAGA